jgi:predicted Zn-dependent protease
MDGKCWKALVATSLLAASAGCRGTGSKTTTSGLPTPSAVGGEGNAVTRMFKPKPPGPVPQFQPVDAAVVDAGKKKGPLKAETVAALANAQVGAAFDFQEEGTVNPNLDRLADDARQKFQKALEQDPKNREALQGLARLYTRLGDRERAVSTLQTLQSHYPNDHRVSYELALTHARFEDWTNGIAACRNALAGDPENRRYQKTLGILTARTGNFEEGFTTLASVMPEAEARFTMAKVLADTDRPDLAEQQVKLALKADPNFAPAHQWLAARKAPAGEIQPVDFRAEGK